ncbi:MAG: hypothetical protein RL469_442 [Pseudomonadota bacterium]
MSTNRRAFLIGIGVVAAGTTVGVVVAPRLLGRRKPPFDFKPNAFVRIGTDGSFTMTLGKAEMGQGIYTGMPMTLAEELDVNPQRLTIEFAPVDPAFNHPFLKMQFTGGSMSTISTYDQMRLMGATARTMLVSAAAARWKVPVESLATDDGTVVERNGGRRATYASLAEDAAKLPVPAKENVKLKDRGSFKYVGKPQKRLDNVVKVTGRAVFGSDVQPPEMLKAVIARAPSFGAKVKSFDATRARAVKGVVDVKQVPSGVAVIAENTWAALKGREALQVEWDESAGQNVSTASLRAEWRGLAAKPGTVGKDVGNVKNALANAARKIDVEYELPYLAHACMEPMNAAALVKDGRCTLWVGTQNQSQDLNLVAQALGIPPANVELHTQFLGGGFGRRASTHSDFTVEAAHVANGVGRPVHVVWTREDDMRGGFYRPYSISRVRAGLTADGKPLFYHQTVVGKPVLKQSPIGKPIIDKLGFDPSSFEGAANTLYGFPNLRVESHDTDEVVTNLWWRSVGNSIHGFVVNGVVDELATLAGQDGYAFRRELLATQPRALAVLDAAAKNAGWGQPLPAGRHHGIALHESFGSIVAEVAEVSVEGRNVRVHRVTCAIDCGFAINPDQVVAQVQSAVIYGLSAALAGEITIDKGRAVQGNFTDYPVLRMSEVPQIDVHIVESDGPLGGLGEPGTPPIAPAVCAAIHAATGQRIRRLPIAASLA